MRDCQGRPLTSMKQLTDAYYTGIEAKKKGKDRRAPATYGPEERRAWRDGYNQGVTKRK